MLVSQQVTNASDSWAVRDVPASQHRLTLTKLDPGSLYEVEMAAHNCAGEGQTAMVTFRTGKGQTFPWVFCSESGEAPLETSHTSPEAQAPGQRGCFCSGNTAALSLEQLCQKGKWRVGLKWDGENQVFPSAWIGLSPFLSQHLSWTPAEPQKIGLVGMSFNPSSAWRQDRPVGVFPHGCLSNLSLKA